ncbi:NEW3 domain-containing protein [Methanogenium marinum]|uniref:NEW3 domain-containing protein n=1 Tax=Methanogenium marinum TaxID=348610 RepID=A0A9Q4KPQ8_9EURY|nr:NEW3 domain-containing protein [Methanogenium marinum]MDE4908015.1 NEW3 domain-containing protein [Methanogenium marinum]
MRCNCLLPSSGMGRKNKGIGGNLLCVILAGLLLCAFFGPVSGAGEGFIRSEPSLYATLEGTNEFSPGTDIRLDIIVENQGVDNEVLRELEYTPYTINPTTALGTVAGLEPAGAPLSVQSEPYLIGDIQAGLSSPFTAYAHVDENAPAGTYTLIVSTNYHYAAAQYMLPSGDWEYSYEERTARLEVPVRIKGEVKPKILSLEAENLYPGQTGTITVSLENIGYAKGTRSAAELSGISGVFRLVDGGVYIGDFAPGEVTVVTFTAYVSDDVSAGTYPEEVMIAYAGENGESQESVSERVGIPVGEGASFAIVSDPIAIEPGETKSIQVTFKNTGDAPVYDARARIVPSKPLTAPVDTALLGDMAPGETMTADFTISLESGALEVPYGLNTEIKYRDAQDTLILSDQIVLQVDGKAGNPVTDLLVNPVSLAVIVGIVLLAGYYLYAGRRKN